MTYIKNSRNGPKTVFCKTIEIKVTAGKSHDTSDLTFFSDLEIYLKNSASYTTSYIVVLGDLNINILYHIC